MSRPRRQRLIIEDIGDVTVVNFVDKKILDEQNIQMIGDDLFRLVEELGKLKLLVNFANVEFYSSAGLGPLMRLHQELVSRKGKLVLCTIAKPILEMFELTKLDKMLAIKPSEKKGLDDFGV